VGFHALCLVPHVRARVARPPVPVCSQCTALNARFVTWCVCVNIHSALEGHRGSLASTTSQHLSPTFAHRRASIGPVHDAGDKLLVISWKRMTTEEVQRFKASQRRNSVTMRTRRALVKVRAHVCVCVFACVGRSCAEGVCGGRCA